jgi:hypothetical protein
MNIESISEIKKFAGINNVDDRERLYPVETDNREPILVLREGLNVDIDNTNKLSSRTGWVSLLAGNDVHSLWADRNLCFFVDGTVMYRLMDDFSTIVPVRTGLTPKATVSYVRVNDNVYYANGYECGYIDSVQNYSFMDPSRNFKQPLPAGSHIEYFMGCLFMAVRNVLYISDPLTTYYDTRMGYKIFSDDITMVRACDNGMYVSDKSRVWFIRGKGNDDFEMVEVESEPAIPFTDVRTSADSLGYGVEGDVVLWTSASGICLGDSGGSAKNLTDGTYLLEEHGRGAAFIRDVDNIKHYINSLY